jgi:hypothetical protein
MEAGRFGEGSSKPSVPAPWRTGHALTSAEEADITNTGVERGEALKSRISTVYCMHSACREQVQALELPGKILFS